MVGLVDRGGAEGGKIARSSCLVPEREGLDVIPVLDAEAMMAVVLASATLA